MSRSIEQIRPDGIWCRMNCLYPPFNNVKARQALLYLVNQPT